MAVPQYGVGCGRFWANPGSVSPSPNRAENQGAFCGTVITVPYRKQAVSYLLNLYTISDRFSNVKENREISE